VSPFDFHPPSNLLLTHLFLFRVSISAIQDAVSGSSFG
jgi:hypothetical protein